MKTFNSLPNALNSCNSIIMTLVLLLLFQNIKAQITINENIVSDLIGKTVTEVLYETDLGIGNQLNEIIAADGPDQMYDFKNLNYIDSTISIEQYMNIPLDDPFISDPNLANSNFIVKSTFLPGQGQVNDTVVSYRYSTLENGDWSVNGAISFVDFDQDGILDSLLQWFSPPSLQTSFPVTYGSEWYDTTSINQVFAGMEFTSATLVDSNWVTGYGTLMTPAGTGQALRIFEKSISYVPGTPIIDIGNDIDFVTADNSIRGSIVVEDERAFYARRTVDNGTVATIEVPDFRFRLHQNYPNPIVDRTTISFNLNKTMDIDISIINTDGRIVKQIALGQYPVGNNEIVWTVESIRAGHYILQMRAGHQLQHRMVSIVR